MQSLDDIREQFEFLDTRDERTGLLVELGRELEPMAEALKTDLTLVRGCQAKVWTYPTRNADGTLHFLADSTSGLTKGMIALILAAVQDRSPSEIVNLDITDALAPFEIDRHLTSVRTSGLLSMIDKVRETARRYS